MAFDALDEHEQSEEVRKWIRDNAMSIVIGIALGLLLIFGWQQWRTHRARHQAQAASEYQAFSTAIAAKNVELGKTSLEHIQKDFSDTAYAVLASLQEGAAALERKDLTGAETALSWAYDHAQGDSLKSLAGQRLVRLRLAQEKMDDASNLLQKLPTTGFSASIAELRGDVLLAQGHNDSARGAYQEAIDALDVSDPSRADLEMKRDNAANATEQHS
ncbi:MAG: tetratricopeptide repeat protein [Tahibacter sp.]